MNIIISFLELLNAATGLVTSNIYIKALYKSD